MGKKRKKRKDMDVDEHERLINYTFKDTDVL
jgi:hypothetical protein